MFDVDDDAMGKFRVVEDLNGPGGRRRWPRELKARIVAESLVPGARVTEVAQRWQVRSSQIFAWRHAIYRDVKAIPAKPKEQAASGFIPIVTGTVAPVAFPRPTPALPSIEVKLAGAVVRGTPGMDDAAQLTVVLRAVRASVSRA
jgi:transposase